MNEYKHTYNTYLHTHIHIYTYIHIYRYLYICIYDDDDDDDDDDSRENELREELNYATMRCQELQRTLQETRQAAASFSAQKPHPTAPTAKPVAEFDDYDENEEDDEYYMVSEDMTSKELLVCMIHADACVHVFVCVCARVFRCMCE
jgi:hypothetical protein